MYDITLKADVRKKIIFFVFRYKLRTLALNNFLQAKQIGCHLITIPPKIIEKIENFGKSFNQLTKETVTGFLVDSKKSKFKL